MKQILRKYFILLTSIFICNFAFGQGRIYTKKVLLADFPTKITKIAIDDHSSLGASLRDEISARWRISPYEFCSIAEAMDFSKDNNFYIMRFNEESGIRFLSVTKGGKPEESDNLKKAFTVVDAPFCPVSSSGTNESAYLGALVDIVQTYIERALLNETAAYKGLDIFNTKIVGYNLLFNSENYPTYFNNYESMTAVGLCIPSALGKGDSYKMIITTDTHELLYFKKIKSSTINYWSSSDIMLYSKKNGIITE